MADCEAVAKRRGQRGRRRHNNQMEEEASTERPPMLSDAKRRWQGVCEISAMAPQWGYGGCNVVGAAAVVHPWGAGGGVAAHRCWRGVSGAFQRAGRWLWRWRQHVNGTMVGAFLGRRVVAAHPWVGGSVLAMLGRRRHWRQLVGNNSTTNLTVVEVEARQRQR
jgi:hypothetical protein